MPTSRLTGFIFFATLERLKKGIFCEFVMVRILLILQAVVAVLLTITILFQNRGSGLGSAFGGGFGGYYTKRGLERFFLYATIVFAVIFLILGIVNVRLSVIS